MTLVASPLPESATLRSAERPTPTGTDLAPVVLFLPAYDEEATVARVIARAPRTVLGHPVQVLVVDDGSSDATAVRAHAAGADVLSLGRNCGLGAAVRVGLATSVSRGARVVAFLDADEEYAPEELQALVAPILAGEADYVVGSRFAGAIETMRPHRRFGNQVLTRILRRVARAPITDGQSGYRALSAAAAADAEVIHDFNYAQVLTLDLLAKGYRYAEVPITYRFRTEGESFVRLVPYLRRVIPAVVRELHGRSRP
jgi:glycosyltransferase involved in cell wall biosynthesis